MAFWLARHRDGQESDFIQRFDPRFWTIDFPRPAMGSVITTGADALRVDVEFHHSDELAGLIWESADRLDHPLLAYATDRNYSRTTMRFRWRSNGVVPLDAVQGPTLTIEGRDATGVPRTWYVRLWNYAEGSSEDAIVTLPFSALSGGWTLPDEGIPVHALDIDRMFVSIAPHGFDPDRSANLPNRVDGWVQLSEIECTGDRPMLVVGDIMMPQHDLGVATAYDDCYNQTPARLLRNMRALGYRGAIIHYVGMSHYYRLALAENGGLEAVATGALCGAAEAWHRNFFAECKLQGYRPIISLSYELFAENCPQDWCQRFADGAPALTGWNPPSTLLSPANGAAMAFLQAVAARFVRMAVDAELPVSFQIGEPWWWTQPDGRIALYDVAATDAVSGTALPITDLRQPLSASQLEVLGRAGSLLAASTAALRDRVKEEAGGAAEVMLLLFTPTFLDAAMPELQRANAPEEWAWPAYDRLQLEDYDWLTAGNQGARYGAYRAMQGRLAYPLERQDYLAGFVPTPENAELFWPRIDAGIEEAEQRGVGRRFIWALPQINRDGYTRLPGSGDDEMQAFDDVLFPLALGQDAGVSAEFSTSISLTASGHERRATHWTDARLHFDVGPGIRSEEELGSLIAFFRDRRGAARGFRLRDPFDYSSAAMTARPSPTDQLLGTGDGMTVRFRLRKHYGTQVRFITRPREGSVVASVEGVTSSACTLDDGGWLVFDTAPPAAAEVRGGFYFDVPVRFATDRLDISGATFAAGEAPSVPLVEVREVA